MENLVRGVETAGDIPEVLASVVEIDDVNGSGKMLVREVPNPFGSIGDNDFLNGAAPAAIPGFQINSFAELGGRFDGSGVGCGVRIPDGIPVFVMGVCVTTQPSLASRV